MMVTYIGPSGDKSFRGNELLNKGVVIFVWNDGLLLVILRDDFSWIQGPGVWAPVSGTIESREDPYDCAVREVREEIGINIDTSNLESAGEEMLDNNLHYYFHLTIKTNKIKLSEGQEYKFIKVEVLDNLTLLSDIHQEERRFADYLTRTSFIEYLHLTRSHNTHSDKIGENHASI